MVPHAPDSLAKVHDRPVPFTEAELLGAVAACDADLEAWRERVRSLPELRPRCALAIDDEAWSYHPLSSVAWSSLCSAVDHLRTVRAQVEQVDIHPFATFSLTRGALLSAAQAVWSLGPEDPLLRQARGVALANEYYVNWQEWAGGIGSQASHSDRESLARVRVVTRMRLLGLELVRGTLPAVGRRSRSSTAIVKAAAALAFPSDRAKQETIEAHWRSSSSDAHGLGWGALTRRPRLAGSSGNLGKFELGGDLESVVEHFKAAYLLTNWAWSRWDALTQDAASVAAEGNAADRGPATATDSAQSGAPGRPSRSLDVEMSRALGGARFEPK